MPPPTPAATREAAVRDYCRGDTSTTVSKRYGCSASAVITWVREAGQPVRARSQRVGTSTDTIAYHGGWVQRGWIQVPLVPESRSA